jgi:hypothetical protein
MQLYLALTPRVGGRESDFARLVEAHPSSICRATQYTEEPVVGAWCCLPPLLYTAVLYINFLQLHALTKDARKIRETMCEDG